MNDRYIRRLLAQRPADAALLAAYESATGRAVFVTYEHLRVLSTLANRDVTPADIKLVVGYVKRRMADKNVKRGTGRFSEASLQFTNLLGDIATFVDRLHTARMVIANARERKSKLVPVTRPLHDGSTVTRLEPEAERAPAAMRDALADALRGMLAGLEGNGA